MPGRGKKNKGAAAVVTPKKGTRKITRRLQSLPVGSPTHMELPSDLDIPGQSDPEMVTLAGVM